MRRKLSNALRTEAKLLHPEQIRANREALGLTQKELARYMQVSEGAVFRWETGAQIQQRCMDAFLRVFFVVKEARHLRYAQSADWARGASTVRSLVLVLVWHQTRLRSLLEWLICVRLFRSLFEFGRLPRCDGSVRRPQQAIPTQDEKSERPGTNLRLAS